jgi:hypothetical protein
MNLNYSLKWLPAAVMGLSVAVVAPSAQAYKRSIMASSGHASELHHTEECFGSSDDQYGVVSATSNSTTCKRQTWIVPLPVETYLKTKAWVTGDGAGNGARSFECRLGRRNSDGETSWLSLKTISQADQTVYLGAKAINQGSGGASAAAIVECTLDVDHGAGRLKTVVWDYQAP